MAHDDHLRISGHLTNEFVVLDLGATLVAGEVTHENLRRLARLAAPVTRRLGPVSAVVARGDGQAARLYDGHTHERTTCPGTRAAPGREPGAAA